MPVHSLYFKACNHLPTGEVKSQKKAGCMLGEAICFYQIKVRGKIIKR